MASNVSRYDIWPLPGFRLKTHLVARLYVSELAQPYLLVTSE